MVYYCYRFWGHVLNRGATSNSNPNRLQVNTVAHIEDVFNIANIEYYSVNENVPPILNTSPFLLRI